jgi:hypothetical protein
LAGLGLAGLGLAGLGLAGLGLAMCRCYQRPLDRLNWRFSEPDFVGSTISAAGSAALPTIGLRFHDLSKSNKPDESL